jgi:hypothetical protein
MFGRILPHVNQEMAYKSRSPPSMPRHSAVCQSLVTGQQFRFCPFISLRNSRNNSVVAGQPQNTHFGSEHLPAIRDISSTPLTHDARPYLPADLLIATILRPVG